MTNTEQPKQPRRYKFKKPENPAPPEWIEKAKTSQERILAKYA